MQWAIADDFFKVAIKIRQVLARKQVGKLGRTHVAGSLAGLQLMLEGLDCFRRARMAIFAYIRAHHRMDGKPSQAAEFETRFVSYTSFWVTLAKAVTFFMGTIPNILQYIGHTQSITWAILT